jgi:hypothetical protein
MEVGRKAKGRSRGDEAGEVGEKQVLNGFIFVAGL